MMKFVSGDILQADTEVIVVPMNTMGVFGAGLAKQVCEQFPKFRDRCVGWCGRGRHRGGDVCWHREPSGKYISGLCTKEDWRKPSELEWINRGLQSIYSSCYGGVTSIAIPKVGCGLGGLDWTDRYRVTTTDFKDSPSDVYVYM